MVKQLECKDIKEYLKTDTKKVLLDVRTQEEWDQLGKPDGEKLGLKTYFLTLKDENFLDDFKKLSINQDYEILSICRSGQRSQFVADLLEKENYKSINISDGFNNWESSGLPLL